MKQISVSGINGSIPVASLILGTDHFGTRIPKKQAFSLLDRYWEAGGFTIDTARIYGHWKERLDIPPCTETLLGSWMKDRGNRDRITLISKGGHPVLGRMWESRLTKECIDQDLEDSLRSLGTDHLEVYFLHRDDPAVPVEEIMDILDRHVRAGRILALGASNWRISRIIAANQYALSCGRAPFSVSEINWSLARTTPEMWGDPTLVTMNGQEYEGYVKTQIPVLSFSSLARGYFSKGIAGTLSQSERALRFDSPENRRRLDRLSQLCVQYHLPPSALATAYLTSAPIPAAAIIGCSTPEQITECMVYSDLSLTPEDRQFLVSA